MKNTKEWIELNGNLMACRKCQRLVEWREEVAQTKRRAYINHDYWGKPVPGFGDHQAKVMVVGLAPGAHGSNRTGRMFTGDASGDFLYPALHRYQFASKPEAISLDDDLILHDLFITAVCRCVPPKNRPNASELKNCEPYLIDEIDLIKPHLKGFIALGKVAFDRLAKLYRGWGITTQGWKFAHNNLFTPGQNYPWIIASYHPSRQNTQTGRLTIEMFDQIWAKARELLEGK